MNDKFMALANAGKTADASAYYTGEMRTLYNKFWADLQADEAYQLRMGQKATQDGAEAYSSARILIMTALGIAAVLCVAMGWLIVSGVSTPIRVMTCAMGRLAQHDLKTQIEGAERKDEVGEMANAVLVFKTSMIDADRLKAEQEEAQRVAAARSALVDRLTREFDEKVQTVVQGVAGQASTDGSLGPGNERHRGRGHQAGQRRCGGLRAGCGQCSDRRFGRGRTVLLHRRDRPPGQPFQPDRRQCGDRSRARRTKWCKACSAPRRRSARSWR